MIRYLKEWAPNQSRPVVNCLANSCETNSAVNFAENCSDSERKESGIG